MLYAAGMFLSSCSEFRFVTMFTWTLVCFLEFELGITLLSCLLFDENFSWCRPYGGAFDVRKVVGSRFFIVSGNISFETVQAFLAEFYHPTHEKGNSEWSASYHGVFIFFFSFFFFFFENNVANFTRRVVKSNLKPWVPNGRYRIISGISFRFRIKTTSH